MAAAAAAALITNNEFARRGISPITPSSSSPNSDSIYEVIHISGKKPFSEEGRRRNESLSRY